MRAFSAIFAAVGMLAASSSKVTDPIILDDKHAVFTGKQVIDATYEPCLKDAYDAGYHQASRNSSMTRHVFEPQVDGCYMIEEWHSGKDQACSKHLSQGVHLEVQYCKNKTAYTMLDQSLNGGQWNILGALPFYRGWTGYFVLGGQEHNAGGHECRSGTCFWASDAFRLTWVSDLSVRCRVPRQTPAPAADNPSTQSAQTPAPTPAPAPASAQDPPAPPESYMAATMNLRQVVVNEAVTLENSAWQFYDAVTFEQRKHVKGRTFNCGKHGWMQNFLYLDPSSAQNTEGPATFNFDPPENGCYLVEEFRPANTCSQSFSKETQLAINYYPDKTMHLTVDQTEYGNRWTSVALLPFHKGHKGTVQVRHPQLGSALAVADAFRFTKVSASCDVAPETLVSYSRLRQHPVSVTLDEAQAERSGHPVHKCDATALWGKAHAVENGQASSKFIFTPPSTGCYRVDEFHPEDSPECVIAKSADIRVDYCLGQTWQGSIALHQTGGQWNTVGHFPFYAGVLGNVTSRRRAELGHKWVADGFRFTKVADSCRQVPHSALVTMRLTGVDLRAVELPDGHLTTHADLRLAMHKAVVAATGLKHQEVRLIGLRSGSIVAEFELTGDEHRVYHATEQIKQQLADPLKSPLATSLCAAAIVGAAPSDEPKACGVELLRSTAVPPPSSTQDKEDESDSNVFLVACVAGGVVFLVGLGSLLLVIRRRCLKKESPKTQTREVCEAEVVKVDDKDKDNTSESGSTATPPETRDCEVQTESSFPSSAEDVSVEVDQVEQKLQPGVRSM